MENNLIAISEDLVQDVGRHLGDTETADRVTENEAMGMVMVVIMMAMTVVMLVMMAIVVMEMMIMVVRVLVMVLIMGVGDNCS